MSSNSSQPVQEQGQCSEGRPDASEFLSIHRERNGLLTSQHDYKPLQQIQDLLNVHQVLCLQTLTVERKKKKVLGSKTSSRTNTQLPKLQRQVTELPLIWG